MTYTVRVGRVSEGVYLLRAEQRGGFFEALWPIPEGVTYNAYLVLGGQGAVLFDGWPSGCCGRLAGLVKRLLGGRRLDMIVVNHSEPDHTGCLEELVSMFGGVEVVASRAGVRILQSLYPGLPRGSIHAVRDGEDVSAGGVEFTVHYIPMLHWPDTMASYLPRAGVLFSCDVFGGFSVPEGLTDADADASTYMPYARKYFAAVVGRYRGRVAPALKKLEGLGFRVVAPGHGLVWVENPGAIVEAYSSWAEGRPRDKLLVVAYTAYGRIGRVTDILVEEAAKRFKEVSVHVYDSHRQPHPVEVLSEVPDSRAVVVLTTTYEAGLPPVIEWLLGLMASKTGYAKPAAVISLHAWGPPVADKAALILESGGFNIVYRASMKGLATEETLREIASKALEALSKASEP